ncbi:MAG: M13 family metallopeptidase [Planctomycetes bacterium]|nr:M13 family metallopeptidase [Planctomycetota bacterium]
MKKPSPLLCGLVAAAASLGACASMLKDFNPPPAWDRADMDLSVAPGTDFYRFANGGWLDSHPVPAAYSSYGAGHEIRDRNQEILRAVLVSAAKEKQPWPGSPSQMLGDFYASGMDEARIEKLGLQPLQALLGRIDVIADRQGLQGAVAALQRNGVAAPFGFEAEADTRDSSRMVAYLGPGGLGLPEKDYYLRDDEESVKLREQYTGHVARMLELAGAAPADAAAQAQTVLALETRLAAKTLGAVEMRDPAVYDDVRPLAEVDQMMGDFDLAGHCRAIGLAPPETLHVISPDFFAELGAAMAELPPATWRTYLRWHLLHEMAFALSSDFAGESFAFYGTVLSGAQEMQPRWKRVLNATNEALGELLGQAYVARAFPPRAKALAQEMVDDLRWAMEQRIKASQWMTESTRAEALVKLAAFNTKIGYPDKWRSYDGLQVSRDSYAANVLRAAVFETAYRLGKIGEPVDDDDWGMNPQVVNAYYHPIHNEIVFPAGILQPPFFSENNDAAVNYGSMGAIIGHEITHGFDDSGAQFDAEGLLRNWWQPEDLEEFARRGAKLVAHYDGYQAVEGLNVNGELTLGENIADQGGLLIAYEALMMRLAKSGPAATKPIGGYTPAQRFFLAFARSWRQNARDEYLKMQVQTDPHSPARFRLYGVISNLPQFAEAWGLDASAPMVLAPEERALVW